MGLRLQEERKQDVLLATVLLHPKVPVEQEIPMPHLCCMQPEFEKGKKKGNVTKILCRTHKKCSRKYIHVCVYTGMHT